MTQSLSETFTRVDDALSDLEARVAQLELEPTLEQCIALVSDLLRAYIAALGDRPVPPPETDILDLFKVLVKGDPSWNTIRDNCRELVYYRNCIAMERRDALPNVPEKMAVRTARHIYLFMKTRATREGRLES